MEIRETLIVINIRDLSMLMTDGFLIYRVSGAFSDTHTA